MLKTRVTKIIINSSFKLQNLQKYQAFKNATNSLLNSSKNPYKRYLDTFMIVLILISIAILIKEVKTPLHDSWFYLNTYIITIIFLIEYILRLWTTSSLSKTIVLQYKKDRYLKRKTLLTKAFKKILLDKFYYVTSTAAIIDLLAILPFFHQLRLLRLFILFRVFKIFRYTQSQLNFLDILQRKKFEVVTLFSITLIILLISAVLIYVMEANIEESKINTMFDAFYWSLVTLSTVGYGDYYPVTEAGKVVAMLIIVSGIGVISFSTSIIVTSFTEQLDMIKENRDILKVSKLNEFYLFCGYSDISKELSIELKKFGHKVVIFDNLEEDVMNAKENHEIVFQINPSDINSYKRLNIDFAKQVKAILTLENSDVLNVYNALTLHALSPKTPIISILQNHENRKKLELCGVSRIIHTTDIVDKFSKVILKKDVKLIIFGYNENSHDLIHNKLTKKHQVKILVLTEEELRKVSKTGLDCSLFDLSDIWDEIENKYLDENTTFFCALHNDADNVFLTLSLRSYFQDKRIVSIATDEHSAHKMKVAGANKVLPIAQITSDLIFSHIKKEIL